jgi:hypothetical protein
MIKIPKKPNNENKTWFLVGVSFKKRIEPIIIKRGVRKEIETTSDKFIDLKAKKKEVKAKIFRKALKI